MTAASTVLIVGASRGLGLALAREWLKRGWRVIATARAQAPAELQALADDAGERLRIELLEMTDPATIETLKARLAGEALDILFVNAGVSLGMGDRVDQVSTEDFTRVMVTNALSPMRVVEALGPLVRPQGAIAVMTSRLGSVSLNETGQWEVYRASKAALNMLMRSYAARHAADGRGLALISPGWVRTDMGGPNAMLDIAESIPGVVDALAARSRQAGLQFFDYKDETIPW